MENTAIFTISKINGRYNFTCGQYKAYNRCGVMFIEIFKTMKEISEAFNNELNIAVLFEID